jgi:hypothetical protein
VESLAIWSWTDATYPYPLDDAKLGEAAQRHKLIVVDTLRRHMKDLNENSSDDMAKISYALRALTCSGATVLALHHAPKNAENKGPRGSTELAAGVDISMLLTKIKKRSDIWLDLEILKTRYPASEDLVIDVTKGQRAPVFEVRTPNQKEDPERQLKRLWRLIMELKEQLGRNPIQSEIVKEAERIGLAGKDTIRRWLEDGDGEYWETEHAGRSKAYEPVEMADAA